MIMANVQDPIGGAVTERNCGVQFIIQQQQRRFAQNRRPSLGAETQSLRGNRCESKGAEDETLFVTFQ